MNTTSSDLTYFEPQDGVRIAYHQVQGNAPGVMFLGGFMSDMSGSKAMALQAHCERQGRAFIRFDYQGHGESSGAFADGTIGGWSADAIAVLDALTDGPQVLVGSSMGGWMMLLAALARPRRVAGLVGIAAAPDFTTKLMWPQFSAEQQQVIETQGKIQIPTDYGDEPYTITRELIEESKQHVLLDGDIAIECPIHLLHGMADPDVPWEFSPMIAQTVESDAVEVTLVKDADHRFSEPDNIAMLCAAVDGIVARSTNE